MKAEITIQGIFMEHYTWVDSEYVKDYEELLDVYGSEQQASYELSKMYEDFISDPVLLCSELHKHVVPNGVEVYYKNTDDVVCVQKFAMKHKSVYVDLDDVGLSFDD